MPDWLIVALVGVFAIHLVAFAALWFRRRQNYYIALVVTFSLLTASFALRLSGAGPDLGGRGLDEWLRFAAWAAAAVSISWTVWRIRQRRQAGRQNCS